MRGPVPPASLAPDPAGPSSEGRVSRLKSAWRTDDRGRTTFRLMPPLVLWWAWMVFAVVNVADLMIQSHDWFAVQVTVAIACVTGIMYACAFRPRVVSDSDGVAIHNPFRDHKVPWGGLTGVFLGDSVEFRCQRAAPNPDKTVYSWALYSPRRSRARAELRAGFGNRRYRERYDERARRRYQVPDASVYGKLPAQAKAIASQHPSHVMASELARRLDEAREAGAAGAVGGVLIARWSWASIAAVVIPVAALIAVIAAR
jgi:hypothetical protein